MNAKCSEHTLTAAVWFRLVHLAVPFGTPSSDEKTVPVVLPLSSSACLRYISRAHRGISPLWHESHIGTCAVKRSSPNLPLPPSSLARPSRPTAWSASMRINSLPAIHDIIIPPTSQKPAIRPPSQPTHLRRVPLQFHDLMLGHADIMVPDTPILAPTRQYMPIPAQRRDPGIMSSHCTHPLAFFHIPNFDVAGVTSEGEVCAVGGP